MAFAAPPAPAGPELRRSSWTPLSHRPLREQIFEERRALLGKWFDKWTDGQRRRVLVDLLERCSLSQQKFCAKQLQARVPTEAVDFTTRLPRVLSLYIFSFLDPRSLCRCAQVSWHWKYLSELDQLWMLKCLRFGWLLNFCPTPFEQGVWKKHYVQMVSELRLTRPKTPSKDEFMAIDAQPVSSHAPERNLCAAGLGPSRGREELRPWRCSDRSPTDTVRYNYLDNQHPIQQARQARRKGGGTTPDLSRQEAERRRRGGRGPAQLRQPSLSAVPVPVPQPGVRPSWARPAPAGVPPAQAPARSRLWNAAIRPGPVRAPEPRPGGAADATGGDTRAPTPPVFEAQPWHIPSSSQGSDTE